VNEERKVSWMGHFFEVWTISSTERLYISQTRIINDAFSNPFTRKIAPHFVGNLLSHCFYLIHQNLFILFV
jgi:hypothetical protein